MTSKSILVYGTDWCGDTIYTIQHLDDLGVAYQYINIEQDPASVEWVKQQNNGKQQTPTVKVGDSILIEPENDELDEVLRQHKLLH